ncbi:MAG: uncharacterized protein A8A55_0731 [Amphiamblys sp. WSBS2006]|nr:MAG: uncharacterized protein A8A55_0731 [Amphiamblys sp. WSBS2006]
MRREVHKNIAADFGNPFFWEKKHPKEGEYFPQNTKRTMRSESGKRRKAPTKTEPVNEGTRHAKEVYSGMLGSRFYGEERAWDIFKKTVGFESEGVSEFFENKTQPGSQRDRRGAGEPPTRVSSKRFDRYKQEARGNVSEEDTEELST